MGHSFSARLTLVFLLLALTGGLFLFFGQQAQIAWYWLVAGLWLLVGTARLSIRWMLSPLRELAHWADAFGRGELSSRIRVRRFDEFGALAMRFNRMADDLQGMLDAKRALLLAISHELRSPLTRVRLHLELMDESPARQAVVQDLGLMRDMIEGLLERERLDGGHAALMLQDCGWSDWVEDLLQRRFASPMAQGLLSVRIEPGLPVVRLDRMRMQVLLGNLLDNALRYNDAAKGAVQLRLQRVGPSADASSGLLLQVRDFGPGVPEDALPQLGQPFFRPDEARTRASGGVGLGLSLCFMIARAHGASLTLRNGHPGLEATLHWPLP